MSEAENCLLEHGLQNTTTHSTSIKTQLYPNKRTTDQTNKHIQNLLVQMFCFNRFILVPIYLKTHFTPKQCSRKHFVLIISYTQLRRIN